MIKEHYIIHTKDGFLNIYNLSLPMLVKDISDASEFTKEQAESYRRLLFLQFNIESKIYKTESRI